MRLLELTRSYYPSIGGFEKSIYDKTRIYQALGIDYNIITTDYYSQLSGEKRDSSVTYLKQYTPYNITPSIGKYLTTDYDVVNINLLGRYYGDYGILRYSKSKIKIILTPHSFYHGKSYREIKKLLEKIVFPVLVKKIDALVAFTEYEKNEWMIRYQIPDEKIFVIPHFVEEIQIPEGKNEAKRKYFLYLGRNDVNKKPELLIESFLRLSNTQYELFLTLNISDISNALREKIKSIDRIKMLGYVDEMKKRQLLAQADVVVFPTTWEAFGYVAFEASLYSKPLICSDIPIFRELLDDRGVIYCSNTLNGFVDGLGKYCSLNEESKKTMGEINRLNAKKYSFESSLRRYKELFQHLGVME
ncbi:MAG: glycosyltransferase family 4 protein [Bacteroidota bacterium]|jgi:glycosyltransferase involved in cell wall biosynthesis